MNSWNAGHVYVLLKYHRDRAGCSLPSTKKMGSRLLYLTNRSTLYENCNVQIMEDTETEDISIGFFREIEG